MILCVWNVSDKNSWARDETAGGGASEEADPGSGQKGKKTLYFFYDVIMTFLDQKQV